MTAASVSAPPSAASRSRLLITPYTPPRDVLVWNLNAKSWLRIDVGNELDPTVDWLAEEIVRQQGLKDRQVRIFAGDGRLLSPLELQRPIDYYTFDGYLAFASHHNHGPMHINVKGLDGRDISIGVHSSDLVLDVKEMIQHRTGILPSDQHLIFAGQQLQHGRTLADYNIVNESTLFLVLRMLGGGPTEPYMFVDMANEAGLQRLQWDWSAPKWRAAGEGLNLEGRCTNSACEAHGQMVIMQMGVGVFDVLLDSNKKTTCCPRCRQFVQPLTCAFTDCDWKWTGLKASTGGDPAQRTQSLDWSNAGDEYVRFSESDVKDGGSGMAAWLRLKIQTRSTAALSQVRKERECSVCLGADANSQGRLVGATCSHCFHAKCLDGWKAAQQQQGRRADCPMCRLPLH